MQPFYSDSVLQKRTWSIWTFNFQFLKNLIAHTMYSRLQFQLVHCEITQTYVFFLSSDKHCSGLLFPKASMLSCDTFGERSPVWMHCQKWVNTLCDWLVLSCNISVCSDEQENSTILHNYSWTWIIHPIQCILYALFKFFYYNFLFTGK